MNGREIKMMMWREIRTQYRGGKPRQKIWHSAKTVSLALGIAIISQAAFAQAPSPLLPRNLSPWGMFLNADLVVKVVMVEAPDDVAGVAADV